MNSKFFGTLVAGSLSSLLAANMALAEDKAKKPEAKADKGGEMACANNSCKGKAECKGFGNAGCAGGNSCKGHGTLKAANEGECKKKGGVWKKKEA